MFCDNCGSQLNENAQFCNACGKRLAAVPMERRMAGVGDGRVNRHLKTVASLWMVYGILRFMEMVWIFVIGRAFLPPLIRDITARIDGFPSSFPLDRLISGGLTFAGFWVGMFSILEVVAAWGLFERRQWGRVSALVLGFLALLRFPFGTGLGIYTLWVLLPARSGQEYDQLASARGALTSSPAVR
jgi:hypothetical protein